MCPSSHEGFSIGTVMFIDYCRSADQKAFHDTFAGLLLMSLPKKLVRSHHDTPAFLIFSSQIRMLSTKDSMPLIARRNFFVSSRGTECLSEFYCRRRSSLYCIR